MGSIVQKAMERGGDDSGNLKPTIIAEPETISPLSTSMEEEQMSNAQIHNPKQYRASSFGKRLSGRASITPCPSNTSLSGIPDMGSRLHLGAEIEQQAPQEMQDLHGRLLAQLVKWLYDEKAKRDRLKGLYTQSPATVAEFLTYGVNRQRSEDTLRSVDIDLALDRLERIVKEHTALAKTRTPQHNAERETSYFPARKSSAKKVRKLSMIGASSDTEHQDGDHIVPSVDVALDNSKAMGYTGGNNDPTLDRPTADGRIAREKEGWIQFKNQVVRLAHTLRLKGWRQVPLERGGEIEVQRLSGALTNAVYVVSPPKNLPCSSIGSDSAPFIAKRTPRKLLLRVYGPQVEHLIDRESELQILRRLARKKIGPRLLGTFINGRFEEYFNATTLVAEDLRIPETSKQIAKRMRELHEGIELLEVERDAGPFVWQNWDKWVARCEEVISWLDAQILVHEGAPASRSEAWKTRGFVCGVQWSEFRKAVENYRNWLEEYYGGSEKLRSKLVFAHNDAQYGNLLRLQPTGESPLLLPANEHKQLVVIDFEYANANTPGLEFANHFTEWCYNYHAPRTSHVCNTNAYPTVVEQRRFISSYVQHVPQYNMRTPATHPSPGPSSTSSISNFMLDSRGPPVQYDADERTCEERLQRETEYLMKETRLWRVANSAQWVAWGIVQAKVNGMEEALIEARKRCEKFSSLKPPQDKVGIDLEGEPKARGNEGSWGNVLSHEDGMKDSATVEIDQRIEDERTEAEKALLPPENDADAEDAEFDYLAYAQQRALFFWGDLLEFGLVKAEELPEFVIRAAKRVPY